MEKWLLGSMGEELYEKYKVATLITMAGFGARRIYDLASNARGFYGGLQGSPSLEDLLAPVARYTKASLILHEAADGLKLVTDLGQAYRKYAQSRVEEQSGLSPGDPGYEEPRGKLGYVFDFLRDSKSLISESYRDYSNLPGNAERLGASNLLGFALKTPLVTMPLAGLLYYISPPAYASWLAINQGLRLYGWAEPLALGAIEFTKAKSLEAMEFTKIKWSERHSWPMLDEL
jgi:hypothetical protein